jgi:uncharacterized protein YdeI (YjbR/CyaY-like superfamily)
MSKKDKRIDAYIAKSADFAQQIMNHLRSLIHKACPDVEETIKWGMPAFYYKGPLIGIAAFKKHAALNFWKGALMKDSDILMGKNAKSSMGNLGRIESISDLPKDSVLLAWIREAKALNDAGVKFVRAEKPKHERKEYKMPAEFKKELEKNKKAKSVFEVFAPSHKREYLEWICEAKTDETRSKRMATAIEWLSEGKSRHWKYQKK